MQGWRPLSDPATPTTRRPGAGVQRAAAANTSDEAGDVTGQCVLANGGKYFL
jgi:hypothetical protein